MKPIEALRQFLAGVCAIPNQLELIHEAVISYDPQGWRESVSAFAAERQVHVATVLDWSEKCALLQKQLDAEREKHDETMRKLDDVIASAEEAGWNGVENPKDLCDFIEDLGQQLTSARADLDSLTHAVVEFRENIQSFADELRKDKPSAGHVDGCDYTIGTLDMILRRDGITIPERLAAWKSREGAVDGL